MARKSLYMFSKDAIFFSDTFDFQLVESVNVEPENMEV